MVCAEDNRRVVFSSRETLSRVRQDLRSAAVLAPAQFLLRSVFSVLFPSDCRLCHTPLTNVSTIPVCAECLAEIRPTRASQCVLCGNRLAGAQLLMGDGRCPNCRDCPPEFDRAISFAEYKDGLRGLVHLLKYDRVTPVAPVLGGMVAQAIGELLPVPEAVLLVPVPLHRSRRRSRGFNQAELIARAAAKRLPQKPEVWCDVLVRQRDTVSQVGLSREERMSNVRDAFRVAAAGRVKGREIILVDDVMTTGTTLSECARVLKQASAERVWAVTVARALDGAGVSPTADSEGEEGIGEATAASI